MKCIEDLFNVYKQIQDVKIDIFGQDIYIIILNYYSLKLINNIKLRKNNKTYLNKITKNNYIILLLSNLSNARYYSKAEEYDKFDGETRINEIIIIGKFKITSNEIIIMGKMNSSNTIYKISYDEEGEYNFCKLSKDITTIKLSKQLLSGYNFESNYKLYVIPTINSENL